MKTNKLITAIVLWFGLTSCSTYYRMTSRIERDGSMYREVYARGDSAFIAGNSGYNPFMFRIGADWKLTKLDSVLKSNFWGQEEDMNVKVCRKLRSVDGEYFTVSNEKEYLRPLAVPYEELKKSFRWFYTYYTYTATYKELSNKGPVPLYDFMTKEEQTIWFRGDDVAYDGLSGMDLNDKLDGLETKFGQWYSRSSYEISWKVIRHFVSLCEDTVYVRCLDNLKDSVYKEKLAGKDDLNYTDPNDICAYFDEFCRTKYFSELFQANQKAIENVFEDKIRDAELFYNVIQFELVMPGRLLDANTKFRQNGSVVWKVDGFRLLAGDYILTAESRVVNYWAFGIVILLILIIFILFLKGYCNNCTR